MHEAWFNGQRKKKAEYRNINIIQKGATKTATISSYPTFFSSLFSTMVGYRTMTMTKNDKYKMKEEEGAEEKTENVTHLPWKILNAGAGIIYTICSNEWSNLDTDINNEQLQVKNTNKIIQIMDACVCTFIEIENKLYSSPP